ncbi:MAG: TRAM domain-containing protein [Clostridia bacterium]|nr:TRAM domain-containing protein [Clostridia bacterium]
MRRVGRIIFSLIGGALGYGIYRICKELIESRATDASQLLTQADSIILGISFAIIFMLVFYRFTPTLNRQGETAASSIDENLKHVSSGSIIGVIGLIVGFVIASFIAQIYAVVTSGYIYFSLTIITYLFLGYVGYLIASRRGAALIADLKLLDNLKLREGHSKKTHELSPKILDTSAIIDGRIMEIMNTGFLEGQIIIPDFVLVELRHIADSSDSLKRLKGRRGLDMVNKMEELYGIGIYNTDKENKIKVIPEVDVKLLKLAQIMGGKVVTNDFNLNKVAAIEGIDVLNVNELSNAVKPVSIPGEKMTIALVKEGKDKRQAVGYLDDGTMIVVEDGQSKIGETVDIIVTSVIQTAAGRMIFGRLK